MRSWGGRPSSPRSRTAIAGAEGGRLTAVTVEGEPGIGKTRLLLAAREVAAARGFLTIAVGADEELRGPFLLARSIFGAPEVIEAVSGSPTESAILAAGSALGGRDDPAFAGLSADQRLLRSFDLATMAVRALTAEQPLALLIDDMQWADEDSLRLLRYVIRTEGDEPDLRAVLDPPRGARHAHRGGHVDRGHGADARDPAPEARAVLRGGDLGVPPADPGRAGRPRDRLDDPRPGGGRAVHRRGDRPRLPRGRDAAARRRGRVDARAQRRAAGAVGGPHADPAARGAPPRRVQDRAGGGGADGSELQPEGPARGSSADRRGRTGRRSRSRSAT